MDDKENLVAKKTLAKDNKNKKIPLHFAGICSLFWIFLFFGVVIPYFYKLPKANTLDDVDKNEFISDRAYNDLYVLSNIGTKMVGSKENEIEAVQFLLQKINQIKDDSLKDYVDMEIDVQQASGQSQQSTQISMYQGVQNVVVKLSPKNSASKTYILVNSHFDSKPYTPSAGDAGSMIVVMLEVLRRMATTRQSFAHPIVFLFNGAEELGLLAAQGFVTQHKWASFCKVVVNLDAAGTGGREVLFQTGPNYPWLVEYYKKYAKHPFATTLAEELFQAGIIPSDTDFRVFKTFGIPGLDMAQCINGEVYHTKYDTIDMIPRGSLQNTGNNILSLVRGLSNATELFNMQDHNTGNSVFFDFLGVYFIHYTEATGKYLNFAVAGTSLLLIYISMWRISIISRVSLPSTICTFTLVLIMQIISFVLGIALPLVVAYVFDSLGLSLVYYSTPLLIIGLYVCPSLIGLALPITIYYSLMKNSKISSAHHLQLSLHSQALILAVLAIALTMFGIRSSYIFMIPLMCYAVSLMINLLSLLHDRGYAWTVTVKICQIISFLYSSYVIYIFIVALTPMGARAGSVSNRDLFIAGLAAVGTVLSFGFLIPLINSFRRPSIVIYSLIIIAAVSMFLASSTQLGFPFRPKTSGQRIVYVHARNRFYEYDGTLSKDESGYVFQYQDRRKVTTLRSSNVNLSGLVSLESKCEKYMMCGTAMPLFAICPLMPSNCAWLPRSDPIVPPGTTTLEMLSKTTINATTVRFEFRLEVGPNMNLFFQTYDDVKISNWSFLKSYLGISPAYPLAYNIYFNHGIDGSDLKFFLEIYKPNGDFNVPLFEMGILKHYIGSTMIDAQTKEFSSTMPDYAIVQDWPATYDRYIY